MNYRGRNKRKPYFSSNLMAKKKKDLFLKTGMKGFICTCNGNERQCIRESYNLLNEYADRLYGEEEFTKRRPDSVDVNEKGGEKPDEDDEIDEFQKEVDALKTQNKESERRFLAVDAGIVNCVFIKTSLQDPVGLCDVIMRDLADKKVLKARFLMRMIPIEITCKAQMDEVINTAATLLDRHFRADPLTYAIVISKRCNSSMERDPLIEKLAGMVQERNKEHKVNLSNPAATILVEAMKGICGLAVIRDYYQLGKYNLRQLCGLPLNDQGDAAAHATSSSTLSLDKVGEQEKPDVYAAQNDSVPKTGEHDDVEENH